MDINKEEKQFRIAGPLIVRIAPDAPLMIVSRRLAFEPTKIRESLDSKGEQTHNNQARNREKA